VLDVAAHGDPLAQGIADYAARELSQLAICLLPMMDVEPPVGVAITGGLLSSDGPLRRSVLARLKEDPGLTPVEAPVDAVLGAIRLAGGRADGQAGRRADGQTGGRAVGRSGSGSGSGSGGV
jgi:hypothetical protein